ncbi:MULTISPECIES: TrmB family transcriptional regulator [Aneurinibacillus]|uniref:Sugar-specific transcriptional regulator TrmB n=1 Tax=Aneurinibacillus thermoaerophilus TaxID=143495 RepID=A0A1G7Y1H3_ANETH|nr:MULTISPECIES: helix-turn-helix domain-containing protein [Aneurinibacillus]AMA72967.1 transcriptional regulator [Aneurinibacillus sp. XH2]MED0675909.1 helix-turn-helix domain-containing protein [Aneurinibacillus thermoaerophilus]MED0677816.1 helix-turn-helix domain-containing protein [Aneurinibacillus thermoaerophilus]MED0737565.1 helix-turn-helix domain-containing protein [Aneurinibacillus thermoaerophilus]MED0758136.1 helix-turn-helix domain-containing protein [Aneurinibacillus thermoaero
MEEIFKELQKFGFSLYECKAYVSLLKVHPVTGYEISKRSGVPRSMIYEVLGKLMDKGAVHLVPSEPVKYSPVPADKLIDRLRKQFDRSFSYLEKKLTMLQQEREMDVIWHIRSDELVLNEMTEMIGRAEKELWLSVWEPQVPMIQEAVERHLREGVHVFSVLFGAPDIKIGATFHHDYMTPEVVKERTNGHLTIVARDGQEVLIANFSDESTSWAVKTHDPVLVLVATEYIRHDIMIEEITAEFGSERLDALWRNNPDLVYVVRGKRFD